MKTIFEGVILLGAAYSYKISGVAGQYFVAWSSGGCLVGFDSTWYQVSSRDGGDARFDNGFKTKREARKAIMVFDAKIVEYRKEQAQMDAEDLKAYQLEQIKSVAGAQRRNS